MGDLPRALTVNDAISDLPPLEEVRAPRSMSGRLIPSTKENAEPNVP